MGSAEDLIKGSLGINLSLRIFGYSSNATCFFSARLGLCRLMRDVPEKRLAANGGLSNLWKQTFYAGFDHQVALLQV